MHLGASRAPAVTNKIEPGLMCFGPPRRIEGDGHRGLPRGGGARTRPAVPEATGSVRAPPRSATGKARADSVRAARRPASWSGSDVFRSRRARRPATAGEPEPIRAPGAGGPGVPIATDTVGEFP